MERPFLVFTDANDNCIFINPEQIRQVIVSENGCEIWFSDTHRISLTGIGASAFSERMRERAIALNGDPLTSKALAIKP